MKFVFVLLLLVGVHCIQSANILVVFSVASPSHSIVGFELTKELAKRGHTITFIAPYAQNENIENVTQIVMEEIVIYFEEINKKLLNFNATTGMLIKEAINLDWTVPFRLYFESNKIVNLLNSNQTFDLIIAELAMCEVVLGHHFKAPVIGITPFGTMEFSNMAMWNSQPFAYVPSLFLPYTDKMTFLQRTLNSIVITSASLFVKYMMYPLQAKLVAEKFPDAPPFEEMLHNISLILVNAHFSIVETPRPYQPNMIPVGGLHVQPQKLSTELKEYLDKAQEGVVLFSLGTNLKSVDLPADKRNTILDTLSKFPQKFLWKFEDDTIKDLPRNVRIMKWIPQRAVLEHPNTKAFITHGGLLSVTEAVYYGVPFIGFPGFSDQFYNIVNSAHRGICVQMDINDLTAENFDNSIREILENPIYRKNIEKYSSILRSQPVQPMDLAVYWVEHVLKYKGAPHLQNAGIKLKWYQAYLLDVIAFITGILTLILYLNYVLWKRCFLYFKKKWFLSRKVKVN